jgi:hypothetical protein
LEEKCAVCKGMEATYADVPYKYTVHNSVISLCSCHGGEYPGVELQAGPPYSCLFEG